MAICFCASGCGCSGYVEGPFESRPGACDCHCHNARCNCRTHRDRRAATAQRTELHLDLNDDAIATAALYGTRFRNRDEVRIDWPGFRAADGHTAVIVRPQVRAGEHGYVTRLTDLGPDEQFGPWIPSHRLKHLGGAS